MTPGPGGMTVNEQLAHYGLLGEFDVAARARDARAMEAVLVKAKFSPEQARQTAAAVIRSPAYYGY